MNCEIKLFSGKLYVDQSSDEMEVNKLILSSPSNNK